MCFLFRVLKNMAAAQMTEVPLIGWLLTMLSSIICLVPAMYILICERRKREELPLFASKYLSFFSYLVISMVPVLLVFAILYYCPGTCHISQNVYPPLSALLWCSLEYYQLSRLYYCFSADRVHSNKGYPKWVFVLIVSLGGVVFVGISLSGYGKVGLTTQCGIRKTGDAYFVRYYPFRNNVQYVIIWITTLLLVPTDPLILALYWWKARSLTPRTGQQDAQNKVYIRIRLILNRIIILSLFYLTVFLCAFLIPMIWAITAILADGNELISDSILVILAPVVITCISYSVYLMQDHNTKEYIRFLSILNRYKFYCCCCCCYGMVRGQYQFVLENVEDSQSSKRKSDTSMNTRNISEYGTRVRERRHVTGMELSIATKTECHVVEEKEEVDAVHFEDIDEQISVGSK